MPIQHTHTKVCHARSFSPPIWRLSFAYVPCPFVTDSPGITLVRLVRGRSCATRRWVRCQTGSRRPRSIHAAFLRHRQTQWGCWDLLAWFECWGLVGVDSQFSFNGWQLKPLSVIKVPISANCRTAEISKCRSLPLFAVLCLSFGSPPDESRVVTLDH